MKKIIIPVFCSILLGFLFGKVIFNKYDTNSINTFKEGEKVYMILLGTYNNMNDIKNAYENIDNFLIIENNNNYFLYSGITKNNDTAKRINKYYKNSEIKEEYINNEKFLNILDEYDKITLIASSDKDLIGIETIVISNYKEMVDEK